MNDILFKLMNLKARGYCCSQMILILALEAQGRTNPGLVRSMGGLCFGISGCGGDCGAFSGGACLIAFYAGKGDDSEEHHDRYLEMMDEFTGWFKEAAGSEYGGTRCDEILDKYPDRSICGKIVADTYAKCMDILVNNGIDPAAAKNG
jgi:hypothetical protein